MERIRLCSADCHEAIAPPDHPPRRVGSSGAAAADLEVVRLLVGGARNRSVEKGSFTGPRPTSRTADALNAAIAAAVRLYAPKLVPAQTGPRVSRDWSSVRVYRRPESDRTQITYNSYL
jgi:hypothetical protein